MKLKFFAYFSFTIACTVFALYIHFPGRVAAKYIENNITNINPAVKIKIENLKPSFPPGIKAKSILINYRGRSVGTLTKFRSYFDLLTIFYGKIVESSFKTRGFDGIISGSVRVSKKKPFNINIKTGFQNLKFQNIIFDNSIKNCSISGKFNGNITANIKKGHIIKSKGKLNFSDLIFQFPDSLFFIKKYSFSTGKINFFVENVENKDIIKIEQCVINGLQANIHLFGKILVNSDFQQSSLNIKVKIILYPDFFINAANSISVDLLKTGSDKAIVNLYMGGTIRNPVITMNQGNKQVKK